MIRSTEGVSFTSGLDINMDYYQIKLDADAQKHVKFYSHGKWKNTNTKLTHGHQDSQDPDVFFKT
jgi:hypothetical protein